jgi:hypothetical protein
MVGSGPQGEVGGDQDADEEVIMSGLTVDFSSRSNPDMEESFAGGNEIVLRKVGVTGVCGKAVMV